MPITQITIPTSAPAFHINLAYLATYTGPDSDVGSLAFLHKVRVDPLVRQYPERIAEWERYYLDNVSLHVADMSHVVRGVAFDLVLAAPSRRSDAAPYLEAIKSGNPRALDLSETFKKGETVRAARASTLEGMIDGIEYQGHVPLSDIQHVLIVDDVFSTGTTAAAMITHLRGAGLPREASVTLATPLRVSSACDA